MLDYGLGSVLRSHCKIRAEDYAEDIPIKIDKCTEPLLHICSPLASLFANNGFIVRYKTTLSSNHVWRDFCLIASALNTSNSFVHS
jgi:hypothetical protein